MYLIPWDFENYIHPKAFKMFIHLNYFQCSLLLMCYRYILNEEWKYNHINAHYYIIFLSDCLLELLERSLVLLNKSQQLTDFIEKFKCDGSDVNAELIQGAQSSCLKIDSLLELLQDRRRQLDKHLQQQRQELAQVLQLCLWDQQENQVTQMGIRWSFGLGRLYGLVMSWEGIRMAMVESVSG